MSQTLSLNPPKTRCCRRCKTEKELSEFCVSPLCKFGYSHTCLVCKRKQGDVWYKKNKEHKAEYAKERRKALQEFSGDWEVYFKNLIKSKHKGISVSDLLELLEEQQGRCALSGELLTAQLAQGKVLTNASMDRIIPGGPYAKSNIRLVCSIVNSMRLDMEDDELLSWCEKLIKYKTGE